MILESELKFCIRNAKKPIYNVFFTSRASTSSSGASAQKRPAIVMSMTIRVEARYPTSPFNNPKPESIYFENVSVKRSINPIFGAPFIASAPRDPPTRRGLTQSCRLHVPRNGGNGPSRVPIVLDKPHPHQPRNPDPYSDLIRHETGPAQSGDCVATCDAFRQPAHVRR